MKKVTCSKCGNSEKFMEWVLIHRYNYFIQDDSGKVLKDFIDEKQDNEYNSVITCQVCKGKLSGADYHQFLDNHTEALFETVK